MAVNNVSSRQYSTNKFIRFKTPMLRSVLCDYCDAYIVIKATISVTGNNDKKLTFENNAPCMSCIIKISNTFIDNAEDLDIVMLIYNMLE